jgi:protein SCO1/2
MTSRSLQRLSWTILAVALLLLGSFALRSWMAHPQSEDLIDLGILPSFSVTNQSGTLVTRDSMAGKIWVADLIFTHCTTFCPQLTERMKALGSELPQDENIRMVSVSVDPTHDGPDTLRNYAALHGADTLRWSFWTGPTPTIYTLIKQGFHLPVDSVGGDQEGYPIIHSPRFVLIDKKGHMRGYYNGLDPESRKKIVSDIQILKGQE